ncbi:MAG TPA: trypsin-like peptidase domain-containing protein [Anaeromyxobacteraceae bacterium]|nr:trypsin-like peptidase domain-containing protein [Anaeromyxobacteraceae bacterium]
MSLATAPTSPVDGALYTEGQPAPASAPAVATTLPELTKLAESAMPAVVGVVTTQSSPPAVGDDALRDLFERLHESPRKGIGSGFVIHRDGWIITNAHVVEGAERVEVDLGGGETALQAKVVGTDAESDIALLKVAPKRPLTPVPLGDSDRLSIAEWVLVIGSPFGLDHSVTVGIVSHVGRSDISPVGRPGYYDFIQTDASINPGNSGGPVLNLRGEVIGIATAVNATGQGIGFAIPINMAKGILAQLKQHGRVVRSWLGVAVREPETRQPGASPGVIVTEVAAGGPAAAAGLRVGDTIVEIEGHSVNTPARLRWYVSTAGVGRQVEVKVRRGEAARTLRAQLGEVPPAEQARAEARALLGE